MPHTSDIRHIEPTKDRHVRKPDGTMLAEKGEPLLWSSYWQRRLDDGDITVTETKDTDMRGNGK